MRPRFAMFIEPASWRSECILYIVPATGEQLATDGMINFIAPIRKRFECASE